MIRARHVAAVVVLALAATLVPPGHLGLAQADQDAAMFRGNAGRTGVFPGPVPGGDLAATWQAVFGAGDVSGIAAVGPTLYVASEHDVGYITALDAGSGEVLWRFQAEEERISPLAVADSTIFAGLYSNFFSDDPNRAALVALDAETGHERWRLALGHGPIAAPAVVDGTVYLVDASAVYAVDTASHLTRWTVEYLPDAPVDERHPFGAPAVVDGVVYVGDYRGQILAIDATTGGEIWRNAPDEASNPIRASVQTPVVAGGKVYLATYEFERLDAELSVVALDAETGAERWRTEPVSSGQTTYNPIIAVARGSVYVSGVAFVAGADAPRRDFVAALDAANGQERWRWTYPSLVGTFSFHPSAPVVVGDTVLIVADALLEDNPSFMPVRILVMLDAGTGEELVRFEPVVEPDKVVATLTPFEGEIAVSADAGHQREDENQYAAPLLAANGAIYVVTVFRDETCPCAYSVLQAIAGSE